MAACGIDLERERRLHEVDVWTSHEGLLLDYEEALTRRDSLTGALVRLLRAHALGRRAHAQPDGAHVEFFAGVGNPLGFKIGPTATADAARPCERLDPDRTPGRLTLICRMGAGRVADALPPLVQGGDRGRPPGRVGLRPDARERLSHGGRATRRAGSRTSWPRSRASSPPAARAAWPGGVHLEFTGEDVTECLGGAEEVLEDQLSVRYHTLCDPRLNARQSLDLAFRLAELMRAAQTPPAGGVT